jgi:phosphonatase-like hydrolase
MIELVVFDLAGTTVYDGDAVNASFRAALAGAGVAVDRTVVKTVMGRRKPDAIRLLLARAGRGVDESEVDGIHDDFVRRMRDHYVTSPEVREVPGAAAAFAALRQAGIKVAVNTGFNRAVAEVLLDRLGWQPPAMIDAAITSDEVPRGRPHPDMIQSLIAQFVISSPSRVVKVGDTGVDLEEGTNAGCGVVIGVTTGSFTREQLLLYPHTHIVESVAAVPALLLPT